MPHFPRTVPAPSVIGDYQAYREYVRTDFCHRCAYCLMAELFAAGKENFELDHFRPKSVFPDKAKDFYNLYYACHPCNMSKHDFWPPQELEARGINFVDLCKDEFETHFRLCEDGTCAGKTESGQYTIDILRLNRDHLVRARRLLKRLQLNLLDKGILDDTLGFAASGQM